MTQPDFIMIPTQLLSDETLQPADRILFGYIYWMTKLALMKCVASNATLGELAGMHSRSVRAGLERLEAGGYIERTYSDELHKHRTEIICKLAFSTAKPNVGANEPTGRRKRPYGVGANEPHNNIPFKKKDLIGGKQGLSDVRPLPVPKNQVPDATHAAARKKAAEVKQRLMASLGDKWSERP